MPYTPAHPFKAVYSSVMTQDVVFTDKIPVDSTSNTPVAMISTLKNSQVGTSNIEALAIIEKEQNGSSVPKLCHISRTTDNEGGWNDHSIFDQYEPVEVAAGTNRSGAADATNYGFFTDKDHLYTTQLGTDHKTWSTPIVAGPVISNLQVNYTPDGTLVLYGNSSTGDLVTVHPQPDPTKPVAYQACKLNQPLSGGAFRLCLTDEASWYLVTEEKTQPVLYVGTLAASVPESSETISAFAGKFKEAVVGYYNASQQTAIWVFVDSDSKLHLWAMGGQSPLGLKGTLISTKTPLKVSEARGFIENDANGDHTLNIYAIDNTAAQNLWVLHQIPGDFGWNDQGVPVFAAPIPIDKGVRGLVCDTNPRETASLFALDGGDNSLRLHIQDPTSKLWLTNNLHTASAKAYEIVRFRTEVNLIDAKSLPVANYPVTLQVSDNHSSFEINIEGKNHSGLSTTPQYFQTDALGKLTFSMLATAGIVAPSMVFNAKGLEKGLTIQPAINVHKYLSGDPTPYNPTNKTPYGTFGKDTLETARTPASKGNPGKKLYSPNPKNPVDTSIASQVISAAAKVGIGTHTSNLAFHAAGPKTSNPGFHTFDSTEALKSHIEKQIKLSSENVGGIWSDIDQFAGDIWTGIKNGVIAIEHAVVTAGEKAEQAVATFTLAFINDLETAIASGVKMTMETLEKVGHFIAGVFEWIGAAIEEVVDWLKALFDFDAILRTTEAFETAILSVPDFIKSSLSKMTGGVDSFFEAAENDVSDAFEQLKTKFAGQSFGSQPNFQMPGKGGPIKGVAPTDFTHNVHHNWLQDKVKNHPTSLQATLGSIATDPWVSFEKNLEGADQDVVEAIEDFAKGMISLISNPESFASLAIPDFLDSIQKLIDAILKLCNGVADAFLGIIESSLNALTVILNKPIGQPLQGIWDFVYELVNGSSTQAPPLTLGKLFAFLAAFPCTVIYKLIMGSDKEPFPKAATMTANKGIGDHLPKGQLIAAAILQILFAVPAVAVDTMGEEAPGWISASMVVDTFIIFALTHFLTEQIQDFELAVAALAVVGMILWVEKWAISAVNSDNVALLFSIYGIGMFIFGVYEVSAKKLKNVDQDLAAIILPLPNIFTFLSMSKFRDNPEYAPVAIETNIVFSTIGYVWGGACQLVDVTNPNSLKI